MGRERELWVVTCQQKTVNWLLSPVLREGLFTSVKLRIRLLNYFFIQMCNTNTYTNIIDMLMWCSKSFIYDQCFLHATLYCHWLTGLLWNVWTWCHMTHESCEGEMQKLLLPVTRDNKWTDRQTDRQTGSQVSLVRVRFQKIFSVTPYLLFYPITSYTYSRKPRVE